MKKKDFLKAIEHAHDDDNVVVRLDRPGIGGTPTVNITSASSGFDWDNGKIILSTEKSVVTSEYLKALQIHAKAFQRLLYLYAIENKKEFMGQPMGGGYDMVPKGSTVRAFKEMMENHVDDYLSGKVSETNPVL